MPLPTTGQSPDPNSPEYIFSQIQNFSSILRDISLNVSSSHTASPAKPSLSSPDQSHNSSLGLLPTDMMSGMGTFSTSMDMENCPPSNISLGRYLQPATQSEPLSDSDDDTTPPQAVSTAYHPPISTQSLLDTPPNPFLVPFPVTASTHQARHAHTSSTPLQTNVKQGQQLHKVISAQSSGWPSLANLSCNSQAEFNSSGGFPWDKIVKGDTSQDISSLQKKLSPDLSSMSDSWHQDPQDPSFCSGKFSARSTSFGGVNNTRDENFSDFGPAPSFQSHGSSFSSQYTNINIAEDSMFKTGFPAKETSDVFQGFDAVGQAELGEEFGDQEFGSLGKEQLKCFLDQEEAECLQANPFMEEEQCEEPANSSVFSGVSDKSIMLRNSNLLGGDTSLVDLGQLRLENQVLTKVSRCEYFRHNSSRLGSLEDSIPDNERPDLGFVHHIRSPERKPCALLSETQLVPRDSLPKPLSNTFSLEQEKAKIAQGRTSEGSSDSGSAASSANTTYMDSGNSTKTVVSLMDQSGTLKADELVSRLQSLADQLGSQAQPASYPDVVEDSISSNLAMESLLEASIQESFGPGNEINLSTISKVLSEASVSNDPQHFVSVILGCLKKRTEVDGVIMEDQGAVAEDVPEQDMSSLQEHLSDAVHSGKTSHSKKGDSTVGARSWHPPPSSTPSSASFNRTPLQSNTLPRTSTTGTPSQSHTLPRVRKSCTPPANTTRQSFTPSTKLTPSESKRAMLRLTPSSTVPLSRVRPGVGPSQSKPIKPFGTVSSLPQSQVVPVKPQQSMNENTRHTPNSPSTVSAPSTDRTTPSPTLSKTSSLPSSLNKSNRQRRPSGARHSSPIKKVVTIVSPPKTASTFPSSDLSQLLESAALTPSLQIAASSHLTTSTPFHPGLNLSKVILDNLTHNHSISPLLHPDTSIICGSLDVSSISHAMYSSLVQPVHCTPNNQQEAFLPPRAGLELPEDWTYNSVVSSHTRLVVSVPVNHNITSTCSMVVKVTNMWVGSCMVPPQHWDQLVTTKWETMFTLKQDGNSIELEFTIKKGGAFTFNIGVMLDSGTSSSGLVRIQVEEPNIQVLTDTGSNIDFGILPEECSSSLPLVLVNCGAGSVPLTLEIRQPNDLFSFAGGAKEISFNIPGVTGVQADGQGVAKEIELFVNTSEVSLVDPKVFQTEVIVILGEKESSNLLGSVDTLVKVGTARLRTKKSVEPVLFNCLPGGSVTQSIQLRNCGNINLKLGLMVEDNTQGKFYCDENIEILPNSDILVPITFTSSPQANPNTSQHSLFLTVTPNGPKHLISLQTTTLSSQEPDQQFRTSRPVLSFGVRKKPDTMSPTQEVAPPPVFPVESDRSVINFLSVPVGSVEEQVITLKNSTSDTVSLNLIIRETENFYLLVPAGTVSTSQIVLKPQDTQDVKVVYRPVRTGPDSGKLVLKPQGRKIGGKSVKASIALCGVAGSCDIQMEGLEEVESNRYQLFCQQLPAKKLVRFRNNGVATGFVKIYNDGDGDESHLDVVPSLFLLTAGSTKDVTISYSGMGEDVSCAPLLSIFTGPELVRQVLKRARLLPGASGFSDGPSLMGYSMVEDFPEEETRQEFCGQVTAMDVKPFYQKTIKHLVSLKMPNRPAMYSKLMLEETLSDTRIDQSIALPLHSTHKAVTTIASESVGTRKAFLASKHSRLPARAPSSTSQYPRLSGQVPSSTSPPQLPNSPPTPDSNLLLLPRHVSLPSGGETIVRLVNQSSQAVHWDLSWPVSKLCISPPAGLLASHGQAVVCIQAVPGIPAWRGQVSVYSDNSVDTMEVVVTHVVPSTCITVSTDKLELGMAVLGSTTTGSITVTNPGTELVQWKAQVEPSFFSLPQCGGLLNPTQSINLPILFKPAAPGSHSASLSLTAATLRGDRQDASQSGPPVLVNMSGTAVLLSEAKPSLHNPSNGQVKIQPKKISGSVSLESELVIFPDTLLGETSVSKVKIKNRSGSDQAVQILPLSSASPFKTVHSVLEVKNQCYCTVPVQFRPIERGEHTTTLTFRWEENIVTATLKGKTV